MLMIFALL